MEKELYPDGWPLDIETLYPIALERYGTEYLEQAGDSYGDNGERIRISDTCLCFYCGYRFDPRSVTLQYKRHPGTGNLTGLCPNCGIDTLLCSADGYPLTDPVFVAGVARYNFSGYCPICWGDPIQPIRWTPIEVE